MLLDEGFTQSQVDALHSLVLEAIEERNANQLYVSKDDRDSVVKENESLFETLGKDITSLGKKDIGVIKQELEKIQADVNTRKDSMRDEISRAHGGVRLDINLEKARIKDESVALEDMVTASEQRVDRELEALNQRMQNIKSNTRSSLIRFYIGGFTIFALFKAGLWLDYFAKNSST